MTCSVDGCQNKVSARGWCSTHHKRWQKHGDPLIVGDKHPITEPIVRFMRKVEKDSVSECWNWTAFRGKDGYGSFGVGPRSEGIELAHRWSYAHHVGPIPDGLYVLHHCDNPSCVNPDHLFVGTQADNVHDMWAKGRGPKVRPGKLSPEHRAEIKSLYSTGLWTLAALGRRYGVSYVSIKRWIV